MIKFTRIALALLALVWTANIGAAISDWSIPDSKWIENEKRIARIALSLNAVQMLIIPVQGEENRFDPIERSLITMQISDRIAKGTGLLVANPTYVSQALGENLSTYSMSDIMSLAAHVDASSVLISHAEHNRGGRFAFHATVVNLSDEAATRSKEWTDLRYIDSQPPSLAIHQISNEIAAFAAGQLANTGRVETISLNKAISFPDSIDQLKTEARKSPLHSAAFLQLIGMLHPSGSFNEKRNRLFERSLIELQKVSDASPDKRYFVARAYALLDRRPAAIYALGKPRTSHEKALLATLNGNLPALRGQVEKMGTLALDFMAWHDLLYIESRYSQVKERDIIDQFIEQNAEWGPFIYRAFRDANSWTEDSVPILKIGLEQLLPAATATLEDFYQKSVAMGDEPGDFDLTQLLWQHIESFEKKEIAAWAANTANHIGVSELDILDLAVTNAVADHIGRVDDDLSRRVIANAALTKIQRFESIYSGHPVVTLQRGQALSALADKSDGREKETYLQSSDEAYRHGLMWTGQMTGHAIHVARFINRYFPSPEEYEKWKKTGGFKDAEVPFRYHEWPRGVDWYRVIRKSDIENGVLQECLDYTWTSFSCLKMLIESEERKTDSPANVRQHLMATHAGRFDGHPDRRTFEIDSVRLSGNQDAEIQHLRNQIENGQEDWSIYYSIGRALRRRGRYQEAQKILLDYPGFSNESIVSPMRRASYANLAGSWFFWIGQHELALPLLQIGASANTGSAANFSSGVRVAFIKGDLDAAEQWTAARAQRYQSKPAIRDLMQLLHIRDRSDLAWSVFAQAQQTLQSPQLLSGALVGHRKAGATTAKILAWIKASDSMLKAEFKGSNPYRVINFAPRYLLLQGIMDRAPGLELANAIAEVQHKKAPVYQRDRYVSFDRMAFRHDNSIPTPSSGPEVKPFDQIETRYEMLAEAMSAFLRGDFDESFDSFNETAHYYYLDEYLPYYAFSAAATRQHSHLNKAIKMREPELEKIRRSETSTESHQGYRFDEDLTYAVLAAFDGEHQDALEYLSKALNDRPFLDERTIQPYYQVVDLADRLYEHTKNDIYRDYSLELSRRHAVIQPMYAWAYFVVAKFSNSQAERIRATASGLSLDSLSHRATLLPEDVLQKAKHHIAEFGAPYLSGANKSVDVGI